MTLRELILEQARKDKEEDYRVEQDNREAVRTMLLMALTEEQLTALKYYTRPPQLAAFFCYNDITYKLFRTPYSGWDVYKGLTIQNGDIKDNDLWTYLLRMLGSRT